jgi:hypothetical protein
VDGTARGDGSREVLRAAGCRWRRHLGRWFLPRSRGAAPRLATTESLADQLRAAGFDVGVLVDLTTAAKRAELRARLSTEREQAAARQGGTVAWALRSAARAG